MDKLLQKDVKRGDLIAKENLYIESRRYYENSFGFPMDPIPDEILSANEFKKITVERAIQILNLFNLQPKDSGLFYHALLLDALPLPPDIIEMNTVAGIEYHCNGNCIKNALRPPYLYVKENIEVLRAKVDLSKRKVEQFQLFDSLGRPYLVELRRIYAEWLGSSLKDQQMMNFVHNSAAVIANENADAPKSEQLMNYIEKFKHENLKRMREIMGKNYEIELASDISSSSTNFNLRHARHSSL